MRHKKILFTVIAAVVVIILVGCSDSEKNNFGPVGSTHKHADIKLYILGNAIDFSQQKYQLKSNLVHFEDSDGDVAHIHTTGMTLGYMLKTLGMNLNENCLRLDTGKEYCSAENAELNVYVKSPDTEWEKIYSPEKYVMQDLDRILISYGAESQEQIKKQMDSVTEKALKAIVGSEQED